MVSPLNNFEPILQKLIYAFITVPSGKLLLSPFNQMLGKEPKNISLQRNKPLLSAIRDCCHLIEMSTKNPTSCKELFTGWPHYIGLKDVSSHGIGGIIMGEGKSCIPTMFCLAWLEDIK